MDIDRLSFSYRNTWCTRHRRRTASLLVGVFLFVLVGCRPDNAPLLEGLPDDVGRMVRLSVPPTRIVSLSPATTELLFAIGAGDRLVGRTRWVGYPPAALDVSDIGDGFNPNVEAIASLNPDLVVAYASDGNDQALSRLDALGIPSFSVRVDRLRSVSTVARRLGELIGVVESAERVAVRFEAELDSAQRAAAEAPDLSAVILTWDNPPIIIGAESFLSELLSLAGARNVFDDMRVPSATVSIETIAQRNPDIILTAGSDSVPAFLTRREWRAVPAAAARRFAHVGGNEFSWPSPRSIGAVRRLRAALSKWRP